MTWNIQSISISFNSWFFVQYVRFNIFELFLHFLVVVVYLSYQSHCNNYDFLNWASRTGTRLSIFDRFTIYSSWNFDHNYMKKGKLIRIKPIKSHGFSDGWLFNEILEVYKPYAYHRTKLICCATMLLLIAKNYFLKTFSNFCCELRATSWRSCWIGKYGGIMYSQLCCVCIDRTIDCFILISCKLRCQCHPISWLFMPFLYSIKYFIDIA